MIKNKYHTISGDNFHGRYELILRGPSDGFILSKNQAYRVKKSLCPHTDCLCGGGYGDGPDYDSAQIEDADFDGALRLIPS